MFVTLPPDTDTGATTVTVLSETLEVIDEADIVYLQSVMVLAYANYRVTVQAFTVTGGGESSDIIVLSPQAGTLCLHLLLSDSCSSLSCFSFSGPSILCSLGI